jgi:hypothetical protein
VQDLDREVLPLHLHDVLGLLLENNAGPVVGVDDLVAFLEITDVLDLGLEAGL